MAFSVDKFRTALSNNGARANLFEVEITFGNTDANASSVATNLTTEQKFKFLCQSASIPGKTVTPLDVSYRGRIIHIPGATVFSPWTTTVINNDGDIRKKITDWMRLIGGAGDGTRTNIDQTKFYGSAKVYQLGKTGVVQQTYEFFNFFPTNVSDIALDWGTDALQTFTCTWRYDYWGHKDGDDTDVITVTAATA